MQFYNGRTRKVNEEIFEKLEHHTARNEQTKMNRKVKGIILYHACLPITTVCVPAFRRLLKNNLRVLGKEYL